MTAAGGGRDHQGVSRGTTISKGGQQMGTKVSRAAAGWAGDVWTLAVDGSRAAGIRRGLGRRGGNVADRMNRIREAADRCFSEFPAFVGYFDDPCNHCPQTVDCEGLNDLLGELDHDYTEFCTTITVLAEEYRECLKGPERARKARDAAHRDTAVLAGHGGDGTA